MPLPFPAFRQKANAWASKNLVWIGIVGFCVACFLFGMINHFGNQVENAIATNPPLPEKAAKAIIARAKADSAKAGVYKQKAKVAIHQADSLHHIARAATHQADSIKSQYENLPATSTISLPALQKRLSAYQQPDTSAY